MFSKAILQLGKWNFYHVMCSEKVDFHCNDNCVKNLTTFHIALGNVQIMAIASNNYTKF